MLFDFRRILPHRTRAINVAETAEDDLSRAARCPLRAPIGPPGPIAINDNLYKKLSFEPSKLEPVIVLGTIPNVLVVKPAFPVTTAQELICLC